MIFSDGVSQHYVYVLIIVLRLRSAAELDLGLYVNVLHSNGRNSKQTEREVFGPRTNEIVINKCQRCVEEVVEY